MKQRMSNCLKDEEKKNNDHVVVIPWKQDQEEAESKSVEINATVEHPQATYIEKLKILLENVHLKKAGEVENVAPNQNQVENEPEVPLPKGKTESIKKLF